jgi:hypothetical protein
MGVDIFLSLFISNLGDFCGVKQHLFFPDYQH